MAESPDSFVRVVFFNVQHGLCCLLSMPPAKSGQPRRYGVVDCNRSTFSCFVESYLRNPPFADEPPLDGDPLRLEFVALTHFDKDHFRGIAHLLGDSGSPFCARRFIGPPCLPMSYMARHPIKQKSHRDELRAIGQLAYAPSRRARRKGKAPELALFCQDVNYPWFADTKVIALAPLADDLLNKETAGGNAISGAVMFRFSSGHVLLIGGDVDEDDWLEFARKTERLGKNDVTSNVVSVPHHAGAGNPVEIWTLFSRRRPLVTGERRTETRAVISCGKADRFPRMKNCATIAATDCKIYCTNACLESINNGGCFRIVNETPLKKALMPGVTPFMDKSPKTSRARKILSRFAETQMDPLDGAIIIEFREKVIPKIDQYKVGD